METTQMPKKGKTTADASKASGKDSKKYGLAPEESIAFLMKGLSRQFAKALERRLSAHNINMGIWEPLRLLWKEDGQFQYELQKSAGVAQPTLVTALDHLEKNGFITRRRNEKDKRNVNIFLTAAGKSLEKEILHYADEIQDIAERNMTANEHSTLLKLFRKLHESLEEDSN
jgi:DNA-binding MarR family transcriptional regulator